LFPMQWTLDRVESTADFSFPRRRAAWWGWVVLIGLMGPSFMMAGAQPMDSVRTEVIVEGLEGRPILIAERMPLTGALRPVKETFVGLDGHVAMAWPADGRLRFLRLDCAGSTWQLPVVIDLPEGTTLVPAPPGRAPFAERPGTVRLGAGPGDRTVERLARFLEALDEVESDAAVAWQKQWLRGDAARGSEAEVLGGRIGEEEEVSGEAISTRTLSVLDSLTVAASEGAPDAVTEYLKAVRWRTELDLPGTNLDSAMADWQSWPAPEFEDASEVMRFVEGALRFADVEAWPDTLQQRHAKALVEGDFVGLTSTTSQWWGTWDPARTEAWLLMRFGRDGFGVRPPSEPFTDRVWPEGLNGLLEALAGGSTSAKEVAVLRARWQTSQTLPSTLRCFDQTEELVRLEDVVGSGPALWLWIDASAPSTTVQLQVLERMIGEMRNAPRDFTWVVADAGSNWSAFLRLFEAAVGRAGGVKRMPFEMVHTGGDIRWTRAFGLSTLPSVRHHGADLKATPRDLPLPGPELSGWLARRP